jgi:PAS domain S-box-containing protein
MPDKAAKPKNGAAHTLLQAMPAPGGHGGIGSASEPWLRAIFENAVDGIVTISAQGIITSLNPAALRLFGYTREELVGQNVRILMPEPYRGEHDSYLRNYRETGDRKVIGIGREVSGRRKDGTIFPLDLAVSEVEHDGERIYTGILRDISERRRVEEERQKFVGLVENSSDFIAMASLSWELLYINKAGRELLGIGQEQVKGLEVRDLWEESTLPSVLKEAGPVQLKGGSFRFQGQVKHFVTGRAIDVDCNAYGILDPNTGEPLAMAFSARDMREQLSREQALRDGEARLKAIVSTAVDGIVTINERGIIEEVNPAARRIFGYEPGEMLGQNVNMLMPSPFRQEHNRYMRTYRHTGAGKIIGIGRETVGIRKDGSVFPLDLSVSEVSLSGRRIFTGIIRDISSRKMIEEHRALLVAELSHRVKNTLATVISIARQTFPRMEPFSGAVEAFDGRIRALAHTHGRLAEHSWTEVSLAEVIDGEVSPYRNDAAGNIRTGGPDVMLKPKTAISLGMAFHELVTNAAKHGALSGDGGSLDIAWDWLRPASRQLRIRWSEHGGPPVFPPQRSGFGRLLLERGLAHELRGKVQLEFSREGLKCTIVFPLDGNMAEDDDETTIGV